MFLLFCWRVLGPRLPSPPASMEAVVAAQSHQWYHIGGVRTTATEHAARHTPNNQTSYFDGWFDGQAPGVLHWSRDTTEDASCPFAEEYTPWPRGNPPSDVPHALRGWRAWTPPWLLWQPCRGKLWYRGRGARPWLGVPLAAWVGGSDEACRGGGRTEQSILCQRRPPCKNSPSSDKKKCTRCVQGIVRYQMWSLDEGWGLDQLLMRK